MENNLLVIASPIGKLGIRYRDKTLLGISLLPTTASNTATPFAQTVQQELENYFRHPQHVFSVEYELQGTAFQKRVWSALCEIPVGTTASYNTLAKKLKTSPRAVGNACRANPLPVIIPCHRVVAAKHIGGYSGKTQGELLDVKKWLLQHEKAI